MMSERPGSEAARRMYKSSISLEEWENCVAKYNQAVACVATGKSKEGLVQWDAHLWGDLVTIVESRSPKHIVLSELADIMKWKLARGKARPLQKLVESNSPASVIAASTEAFKYLSSGHWEKAIDAITSLKAVGVATATAILAPFSPALVPFMADEVMEAVSCKRDYTMKIYKEMRTALIVKAQELQQMASETEHEDREVKEWTAELVGKALWVKAMMQVYPEISSADNKLSVQASASAEKKGIQSGSKAGMGNSKRKASKEEEDSDNGSDDEVEVESESAPVDSTSKGGRKRTRA